MSCQPASEVSKPIAGRTIGASLAEGDRLNLIVLGVNEMTHGDVGLRPGAMLSAASTVACGWSGACIGSRFDSMHRASAQRGVRSRSLIVGGRHILALAALSPSYSAALCCLHPSTARAPRTFETVGELTSFTILRTLVPALAPHASSVLVL